MNTNLLNEMVFDDFVEPSPCHEIIGTNFNDLLEGTAEDDCIDGLAGNDTLYGSLGDDQLNGGMRNDTADYSNTGYTIILKSGGVITKYTPEYYAGLDRLYAIETIVADPTVKDNTIDAATADSPTYIYANLSSATLKVHSDEFYFRFTVRNFDHVRGTNQSDILIGDSQTNHLWGQGGEDYIEGNKGNDYLFGGYGLDVPIDSYIKIWDGNDVLDGGRGNDVLYGGDGDDLLDGGKGKDTADYSNSSYGLTLLPTEIIEKRDYYNDYQGSDQLVNIETIIANFSVTHNTIDASTATTLAFIKANLSTQTLEVYGDELYLRFTVQHFDDLKGTNESDTLTGDSQVNELWGNGGNDYIIGLAGDDCLIGGGGNDILFGGNGSDKIVGVDNGRFSQPGFGERDSLSGSDADTLETNEFWLGDCFNSYYFDFDSAGDVSYAEITDFRSGLDKIQLYGDKSLYSFSNWEIYYGGYDLIGIIKGGFNVETDLNFAGICDA